MPCNFPSYKNERTDIKIILFILPVGLSVSFTDVADRSVKKFEMVEISKTLITDTAIYLDFMHIRAKAQVNNGCWSKLYFESKKIKEFEYTLKAYGTYESFEVCAKRVVTEDSNFDFQPTGKGTYLFHVSQKHNELDIHTMIVA